MDSVNQRFSWVASRDGNLPAGSFRQALGRFGSGVTVVSVATGAGYHAMTANAFMSISLEPPLVAISVGRKARMNEHLTEHTRVGISVLSESQQPLAWHFGGKADPDLNPSIDWEQGVPLMRGSAAAFVAEVDQIHEAGDHRIFLAKLSQLQWHDAPPLMFWGGSFGEFSARRSPGGSLPCAPDFWC